MKYAKKVPSNLLVKSDICIDLAHLAIFFFKTKKAKKNFLSILDFLEILLLYYEMKLKTINYNCQKLNEGWLTTSVWDFLENYRKKQKGSLKYK